MIELIPPVLLPSDAILNFTVRSSLASEKKKKKKKKFLKRTDIVKTETVQARGFFRLIEASKHTSTCVKKVIETNKTS